MKPRAATPPSVPSATLLLVDCDPDDPLIGALAARGCRLLRSEGGAACRQHARERAPDLILLDATAPAAAALDTCRLLRAQPETNSIPVMLILGSGALDPIIAGLEAGAVECLLRPLNPEEAALRVAARLALRVREAAPAGAPPPDGPGGRPAAGEDGAHRELRRQIAERERAEAALRESERRYRDIFDNVSDALFLLEVTEEGRFRNIEVNPALERSAGIPRALMLGRYVDDVVPAEVGAAVVAKYQRCVAAGTPCEEEVELDLPAGRRCYRSTLIPLKDGAGRVRRIAGITRDITAQKRAEALVQKQLQAEARFRNLAENAPDNICRYDRDCRMVYLNPRLQATLGAPADELIGRSPNERYQDGRFKPYQEKIQACLDTGQEQEIEIIMPDVGEGERYHHIRFVAEREAQGAVVGVLAMGRDVTERRHMEEALRESEEKYRTLIQKIQAAVVVHASDTRILICNQQASELLGLSEAQLLGRAVLDPLWRFIREDGAPALPGEYPVNEVLATGRALRNRVLGVHRPDRDDRVWVLVNADPVMDRSGAISQVIVTFIDLTERKRAEEALADRERQFRTLAENLPDSIIRYNRHCQAVYVSAGFYRTVAAKPEQMLGRTPCESVPGSEGVKRYQEILEQVLREGSPASLEIEVPAPGGGRHTHQISFVAERRGNGEIRGALAIGRDITPLKEAERRLAESHAHLRALTAQRETARDEERKRVAQEIHDELGQLLTALKLGISTLPIRFGQEQPALAGAVRELLGLTDRSIQVVRNLSCSLRPAALEMGIVAALEWLAGEFERHSGIPCLLDLVEGPALEESHAMTLFRVAQEGLTNIARHARAGRVELRLRFTALTCRLDLIDDGLGFDPGQIGRQSFGLLGMRERVEGLGGSVAVDSALGRGTRITAELPRADGTGAGVPLAVY